MLFKRRIEFHRVEKLRQAAGHLWPVCQVLGQVPCDKDFRVTKFWVRYSFLACSAVAFVNVFLKAFFHLYFKDSAKESTLSVLLSYLRGLPVNICLLSHALSMALYRQSFQKLFEGLLELTDFKDRYFFSTYALWYCVLKSVPSCCQKMYRDGLTIDRRTIFFFTEELVSTMICLMEAVLCLYLELIRYQFKRLVSDMKPNPSSLVLLTKRHYHCIELANLTNDLFSWQLLAMCAGLFIRLVLSVYDCIVGLKIASYSEALNSAWKCIRQLIIIFSLAYSCEETKDGADDFNDTLFKMMRENKELCDDEKLNLYVTMKQSVNFSACGFFYVGYPLVTSILAAATTYLVILVQFNLEG